MLVDTFVWIDHFRSDSPGLRRLLDETRVVCHPLIIGELACGQIKRRTEVLASLAELPAIPVIEHEELLAFIEAHTLCGQGLGWIDAHLLAGTFRHRITLWAHDQPLRQAARRLHCCFEPSI